jgi:hypothetical protein
MKSIYAVVDKQTLVFMQSIYAVVSLYVYISVFFFLLIIPNEVLATV